MSKRHWLAMALMLGFSILATPHAVMAKDTKPAAAAAAVIDLNTASLEELQSLSGVGPVKAQAIIDGRPYSSLKDFDSRNILSASVMDKLKGQVSVSKVAKAKPPAVDEVNPPEPTGKIDLNSASADEFEVLPGIGPARAKAIVEGRPYTSLAQFEDKGIVAKSTVEKFKGAIEVVPVSTAKAAGVQGTPGQAAAQRRIKMCGAKWRGEKAENRIPAGESWPQYWSACNTMLKKKGY